MRKCPSCGMDNQPSAKFCGGCGAPLPEEAPVEIQPAENEASAAQPVARTPDKKKSVWMNAAILALVLVAGVLLFKGNGQSGKGQNKTDQGGKGQSGIGQSASCSTCDEILDLQEELQAALAENEDNSLSFDAFDRWNIKVETLSSEIQLLKDHECGMPIRQVEDQECFYGRYAGRYTGDWKSTSPCGEGVFFGSYMEGSARYVFTYSGEWSGGAPNGTGSMIRHREYLGTTSVGNWLCWFYEGTFANGALTGSGWSSRESSTGDRFEYFGGVYRDGFLEGQADFLHYIDGGLYDKGIAEGAQCVTVYSERQEILNTLNTAGAILVAGVASQYLFDVIDITLNGTNSSSFKNSSAGKWLASESASIKADLDMWYQNKEKEESKQQLYDTWQALESRVRWCETSPYDYVREDTDYFRSQAEEARNAYYAS